MAEKPVEEIFADGVGRSRCSGGVVRIDLVSATAAFDAKKSNGPVEVVQRIVMPIPGFLRTVHALNSLLKELVDAGVVSLPQAKEDQAKDGKRK